MLARMPDALAHLRTATRALARARERHAAAMRAAREAGHSLREIGAAGEVSHMQAKRATEDEA